MSADSTPGKTKKEKLKYTPPKLVSYGSVAARTAAGSNMGMEMLNRMGNPNMRMP